MRTLVFSTNVATRVLETRRVYYVEDREVRTQVLLITKAPALADMLTEIDDGADEHDIRAAIQAAALACDWTLANEIATRYGLSACLRCADDVSSRPTWRAHRLGIEGNWGEICGSCAVKFIEESDE